MNSIVPIIKELERIYDLLAKEFELKAERPFITIQTKGRNKQTLGWFWKEKWTVDKKDVGEINICAEELKRNPVETLIHEMVHYSNHIDKVEDCNPHGYHNKLFKLRAECYGLTVNKMGRHGYAHTEISEDLNSKLAKFNIDYKLFELFRKENITIKAETKMKKYRCNCTTVRCATELEAQCSKCNQTFNLEE